MGPYLYTEEVVRETLEDWFSRSEELFAELYLPNSGGSGFFYILRSYSDYHELMEKARPGEISFVLRDRQFPVRGHVDDSLIAEALNHVRDGDYYSIIFPSSYPSTFDVLGEGNTISELQNDFEKLRGEYVWVGRDLEMPEDYSNQNFAENALVARKPEWTK